MRLGDARILLLPPRVEVYETVMGLQGVLKQDWTENARAYVRAAIESVLGTARVVIVPYDAPTDPERQARHAQVLNVHALVDRAIVLHQYNDPFRLPSKQGRFEWSVGPGAAALGEGHRDVRYALFVELTERRMVGGRFITLGAYGRDRVVGTASLVDLGSGDVLWFNKENGGDLDTTSDTLEVVRRLLRDLPF